MDAIISAGGVVKEKGLLSGILAPGTRKAMLELAGKPMIQWELDAVANVDAIDDVIIIGLNPDDGLKCGQKQIHYIPDAGGLIDNFKAGASKVLEIHPDSQRTFWFSSDVPLIRPEMIEWLIGISDQTDHDVYYPIIEQQVMKNRYPESRRTYTRLKDMAVCGGDFGIFRPSVAAGAHPALPKISVARKSVAKQAALVGIWPLLILLTRQMTLSRASRFIRKRLDLDLAFVNCPYAEAGMDVDKPFQYEIVKKELETL